MPLHRDIFWLGRQWAVTGSGMQAINQKHEGQFDIPIERLWDDDLPGAARDQKWFNPDDFNKGLEVARARHSRQSNPAAPRPVETPQPARVPPAASERAEPPAIPVVQAPPIAVREVAFKPIDPPKPAPSFPQLRLLSHPAKLLRVWRARLRR
ncbi:MAG: hypothetical protein U1E61_05920 [Bradyrhizobium sp.]